MSKRTFVGGPLHGHVETIGGSPSVMERIIMVSGLLRLIDGAVYKVSVNPKPPGGVTYTHVEDEEEAFEFLLRYAICRG